MFELTKVETAFEFAISNRGDLPPTLPERRAPLLPRYVVRMLELSVVSPDERVRRSCAFTVLSYMTFGRYGINHAMRVEDVNAVHERAEAVRMLRGLGRQPPREEAPACVPAPSVPVARTSCTGDSQQEEQAILPPWGMQPAVAVAC